MSEISAPSAFFSTHFDRIHAAAAHGAVVDLACGRGRHALALARAGIPSIGMDRNADFLRQLRTAGELLPGALHTVYADFESPPVIPLRDRR